MTPAADEHYTFVLWKWMQEGFRSRYLPEHVNVMRAMIDRWCPLPHRIVTVTDDAHMVSGDTYPLWDDHSKVPNASGAHLPSCYRRLKLFDQATQQALGIKPGTRIVSIDLDAIIMDDTTPLLRRTELFVGWCVRGHAHPRVFNGSMWMFTAGNKFQWMWDNFHPIESVKRAHGAGYFGSDQSYISHQLVNSRAFSGDWAYQDGVLSYSREVRVPRVLPAHARVVMFHGKRKPWDAVTLKESPWVRKYWRA